MRRTSVVVCCAALACSLSACADTTTTGYVAHAVSGPAGYGLFHTPQALVTAVGTAIGGKPVQFSVDEAISGQTATEKGQGRFDGPKTEVALKIVDGDEPIDVLIFDTALFFELPPADRNGSRIAWLRVPTDGSGPADANSLNTTLVQVLNQVDPTKTLDKIGKAGHLVQAERTTLDGRPVSHYTVSLEYAKMADDYALSAEQTKRVAALNLHLVLNLWLDAGLRPVRAGMDLTTITAAAGQPGDSKYTVDYSSWGSHVDVTAPPADQIGDYPKPRH
jgi:hypothetical protein